MKRSGTVFVILCVLAVLAGQAMAAPTLVPPGLSPGDPYHLVFVSSVGSDANLGGIAGGDAFVQGLADAAGIGVSQGISWQAILSDSLGTDAIARFNPSAPIYDTQGNRVAVSGAALWNTTSVPLENPIGFDENGLGGIAIPREVWTGTDPLGFFDTADSDWLASSPSTIATAGSSFLTGPGWINGGGSPAENVPLSVFAASEQLVVPSGADVPGVPEPSTAAVATLGLLLLALRRRRRA
jgi:MYXO-CTERM domain-containing protein